MTRSFFYLQSLVVNKKGEHNDVRGCLGPDMDEIYVDVTLSAVGLEVICVCTRPSYCRQKKKEKATTQFIWEIQFKLQRDLYLSGPVVNIGPIAMRFLRFLALKTKNSKQNRRF